MKDPALTPSGPAKTTNTRPAHLCCALVMALTHLAEPAGAIERHAARALPDDGFGSSALAVNAGDHSTSSEVVGSIVRADGSSVAALWTWNDGNWTDNKLPTPEGFESVANAVAFAPLKPAELVVGMIFGPDGRDQHPAIWTKVEGGDWSLDPIWEDRYGRCNGVTEDLFGAYNVVGVAQVPGGNWHAIIATELDAGFDVTDLGTLGGANSEAEDIIVDSDHGISIVGRAQIPNGRWRATQWHEGGNGEWQAHDMGALHNSQSQASATFPHNDGLLAVGSSFLSNGRSRGVIFWMDVIGDAHVSPLDALGLFKNSSASDGLWLPGGTSGASSVASFRAVGSAWTDFNTHDPSISTGVVWSGFRVGNGEIQSGKWVVRGYPITSTMDIWGWQPTTLSAIGEGGLIVGDGLFGGPGNDTFRALAIAPTDVHMPDAMQVLHGRATRSSSVEDAWWADDERLSVVAGRSEEGRLVDVAFQHHMPFMPPGPLSVEIHLTASLVAKGSANASGEQRILVYKHALQQWETVSTSAIGVEPTSTSVTLPWSQGDWNGDGVVRVRVVATSEVPRRRWGYAVDEIVVTALP